MTIRHLSVSEHVTWNTCYLFWPYERVRPDVPDVEECPV